MPSDQDPTSDPILDLGRETPSEPDIAPSNNKRSNRFGVGTLILVALLVGGIVWFIAKRDTSSVPAYAPTAPTTLPSLTTVSQSESTECQQALVLVMDAYGMAAGNPNDENVRKTTNQTLWWCKTAEEWLSTLLELGNLTPGSPEEKQLLESAQISLYNACATAESDIGSPVCVSWTGKLEAAKHILEIATCDDPFFLEEIYLLSEDTPSGFHIIKIYEPIETARTNIILECQGKMVWNDNDETLGVFSIEIDQDGDIFYGYHVQQSTCETAFITWQESYWDATGNPNDTAMILAWDQTFWQCQTADDWISVFVDLADPSLIETKQLRKDGQVLLYETCVYKESTKGSPVCTTWDEKLLAAKSILEVTTCDDPFFLEDIYLLSEDNSSGFHIITIYETLETTRTDILLECQGKMVWNDNDETLGVYSMEINPNGELLVWYNPYLT